MRLREFVRQNRREISRIARDQGRYVYNDRERTRFVITYPPLFMRAEKVCQTLRKRSLIPPRKEA